MTHAVLYKRKDVYACFPSLLHHPNGTLTVSFSTRTRASHIDPTGGSMTLLSRDGGESWSETEEVFHNPDYASSDGVLSSADAYAWRYTTPDRRPELEAQGVEVRDVPDGSVAYAMGCFARRSADGGATWVQRELGVEGKPLMMGFHDSATFLRYDDGLIMRLVYGRPVARVRRYEVWLLRSEDNGETWSLSTVATDPSGERGYGESALTRCSDGSILSVMRTEGAERTLPQLSMTRSLDRGRTWTSPETTPMHGHPPDLCPLGGGRILCTYGHRKDPMGIRAMLSTNDGRSFDETTLTVLRADGLPLDRGGRGGNLGYPMTTRLGDGGLLTVYYMTGEDSITHVAATRWREEEIGRIT